MYCTVPLVIEKIKKIDVVETHTGTTIYTITTI